ncbi:hypothetical protein [Corynebacterium faecale]|uniref:hypothetical protein n=1 Tax=Corynebacterium faecale TaxID=1758466 RepID=UPI0025B300EF|nr:hypothetical protein [Corynebacterium faecale]
MNQLREIGYLTFLPLFAGAVSMSIAAWVIDLITAPMGLFAWVVYLLGCLLLTIGTVMFCIRVSDLAPTWTLVTTTIVIAALFGLSAYLWLIPVSGEPVIFHPSIALQFFNLVWLVITFVMMVRTINRPT